MTTSLQRLLLFTAAMFPAVQAFGVQVPAGGLTNCFLREIHSSSHVSVHYVAGETINVSIKSPSGTAIHTQSSILQGEYTFDAQEDGAYQFCLSTDPLRRTPIMTKFRFLVLSPEIFSPDIAQSNQVANARNLCQNVTSLSKQVLYLTHLYSDTAIATDDALKSSIALSGRLSALECVAVLLVALSQVTHFRNMLSVSRAKMQRMV